MTVSVTADAGGVVEPLMTTPAEWWGEEKQFDVLLLLLLVVLVMEMVVAAVRFILAGEKEDGEPWPVPLNSPDVSVSL